ncbi:MAG: hypothetical protein AVDCRST_MAG49-3609 [uncultured Thermomicrobiales bacterium]|uniref:Uncharacterized protein n=1 Tax=uncultured Thermomicrobiales bacterium TaxID=1645740 RepID=A0A6J4VAR6_9BACT|nr:MAG: hypothetical protein AVDCRST_MAG49-3609 [uncultured Thermomicrobiales bacterium]
MRRSVGVWPAVIIGSSIVVGILTFADVESPVRSAVSLWFLIACPGMAVVRLIGVGETAVELTLAVALSLALDTLVAMVMLYAGMWSPEGSLAVLIGVSLVGAGLQILRTERAPSA